MSITDLDKEIKKISDLIPALDKFWGQELREIPGELQVMVKQVRIIPAMTSAGLEAVSSILDTLYMTRVVAKKIIQELQTPKGPAGAIQKPAVTPTRAAVPPQQINQPVQIVPPRPTPAPPPSTLSVPPPKPKIPTNAPTPQNPRPMSGPTPPPAPKPKSPNEPIDFGPYGTKTQE